MIKEENVENQVEVPPQTEGEVDDAGLNLSQEDMGDGDPNDQNDQEHQEYVPNPVFKVHDQEQRFDDFLISAIKSEEDEKRVREIYERAAGLDHIKEHRQFLRDENTQLKSQLSEFEPVKTELQKLGHYLKTGDLDSFFAVHQLTDEQIAQHLLRKQELAENPVLKQEHQDKINSSREAYELKLQNQSLQSQIEAQQRQQQEFAAQQRDFQLNQALSDPSISSQVQAFDARMGEGAFRREVIMRGQAHWAQTQQDLSPHQAVQEVTRLVGFAPSQVQQQPIGNYQVNQPVNQAPQMQGQHNHGTPPVIPNIDGSSTTPVRKIPTSVEDLHRIRETLLSQ